MRSSVVKEQYRQNFGVVQNAFIHIVNDLMGREIARYELTEDVLPQRRLSVAKSIAIPANGSFALSGKTIRVTVGHLLAIMVQHRLKRRLTKEL